MANYMAALPELFLAAARLLLLMVGVFHRQDATPRIAWLSVLVLIVTAALVLRGGPAGSEAALNNLYVIDRFAVFLKVLVLAASAFAIIMSLDYIRREG